MVSISEAHNRIYALLRQAIHQEVTNFTGSSAAHPSHVVPFANYLRSPQSQSNVSSLQHYPLFGDRQALHLRVLPRRKHRHIPSIIVDVPVSASFINIDDSWSNTKIVIFHLLREGEPYLQRTLYPFVSNICKNEVCFEMDPHRETNPVKVEANLSRLLCTAKQVVDHICCSLNSIPKYRQSRSTPDPCSNSNSLSFRHQHIATYFLLPGLRDQAAVPRGGQHGAQRILLPSLFVSGARYPQLLWHLQGYISSRLILVCSHPLNVCLIPTEQPTPIASRSLILLSKLLQTVSTGAEFGMKEVLRDQHASCASPMVLILFGSQEYLSIPALNNFVAAYTPSLNRFFALLVVHLPSYFNQKRSTSSLTEVMVLTGRRSLSPHRRPKHQGAWFQRAHQWSGFQLDVQQREFDAEPQEPRNRQ